MSEKNKSETEVLFPDARRDDKIGPEEAVRLVATLKRRIGEKIEDYEAYQFSKLESRALNVFFDLAQEFTGIHDLWALCVIIPKVFFQKDATLFILNNDNELEWRCCSTMGCHPAEGDKPIEPIRTSHPKVVGGLYYIPIKGNRELIAQLPFKPEHDVIGLLVIRPAVNITPHEELFFEKYANRIGYRIHNRIISHNNNEHLKFIRNLVDDIGHNVIVPNMYFKLYYRRLESKIKVLREISKQFSEFTKDCAGSGPSRAKECKHLQREMDYAFEALMEQYQEIYRHYEQTSLFLETLLRRSHFEQGRYVLEMRPCKVRSQIIEPQLDRYRPRLEDRGIELAETTPKGEPREVQVESDVGLISQVFANLLSNAVKYAEDIPGEGGGRVKKVEFGYRTRPDFFDSGGEGVEIYVTSTGENLSEEEVPRLFTEGFRGRNSRKEYGTGHGLSFVKEVVGLHRGAVGYEPAPGGNTFYFVLRKRFEA